jgi:hypothetical protein
VQIDRQQGALGVTERHAGVKNGTASRSVRPRLRRHL